MPGTTTGAGTSSGGEATYRGRDLGLPADGPGSLASFGRRLAALALDWLAATVVTLALTHGHPAYGTPSFSVIVLGVFGLEVFVLTWLAGGSFAQRLLGLHVVSLDRGSLGPVRALFRTVLICLAIPPLVWDRDGRGLHDRAVNGAVLRSR
jgi:uncharacterized RDD family membrane protein YckC